jgi:hypothetical protein
LLGGLVANWLPVERRGIRVSESDSGNVVTVQIAGVGDLSSTAVRDTEGNGFAIRGGGFVGAFGMEEAELAGTAGTRLTDAAMPRVIETKSGARGIAVMSGG